MKTRTIIASFLVLASCAVASASEIDMTPFNPERRPGLHSQTREEVCLNGAWRFAPMYDDKVMYFDEFPDPDAPPKKTQWQEMLVPGHFRTDRPGVDVGMNLPDGSRIPEEWNKAHRAWYQRDLAIPSSWADKTVTLRFGAVAFYAKVFVNDTFVGEHFGGLTPFSLDVSEFIEAGKTNTLSVYVIDANRVSYCPPNAKGYKAFGTTTWMVLPDVWAMRGRHAGIWQDVFIEAVPQVHIEDLFVIPSVRNMTVSGQVAVRNAKAENRACLLSLDVLDTEGNTVLNIDSRDIAMLANTEETLTLSSPWKDPKFWDVDEPNLYYMRARLHDYGSGQRVIDEKYVRFGFRECWVEGDQIYLNGRIFHPLGDWVHDGNVGTHYASRRYEYCLDKFRHLRNDLNFLCPRFTGACGQAPYDAADALGFPLIPTGYAGNKIDPRGYPYCVQEWEEYIKSLRNHPSVLIWSVQNESLIHHKTHAFFVLQRKLDQLLEELDPTRPYYHDGHAVLIAEDRGAVYENGDLAGNAPMSGGHYTIWTSPMSTWMHEFDHWKRNKPFVYGEAGTFGQAEVRNYAQRFYGRHYDKKEADSLQGRVFEMVLGSWRSYAVPAIMPNAIYSQLAYNRRSGYKPMQLYWNDLTTPGPKPFQLGRFFCHFYNPYEPDNPPAVLSDFGRFVKKAFAPVLVTLYRDLRHNYVSEENASKTVYIVNDTKSALQMVLTWEMLDADGKLLSAHTEKVCAAQGRPVNVTQLFAMPAVGEATSLKLAVHVQSEDGLYQAEDYQDLTVYPVDPTPRLTKEYSVYEKEPIVAPLLRTFGAKVSEFDAKTFAGDAAKKVLIVGHESFDQHLEEQSKQIDAFLKRGGVVVILDQKVDYPWAGSSNVSIQSEDHPLFKGLADSRLYFWAGKDNLVAESGYSLSGIPECVSRAQSIGTRLIYSYCMELRVGKGDLLGSNMLLATRYGNEPEARLLFHNMLRYVDARAPQAPATAEEEPDPAVYLQPFKLLKETIVDVKPVTPKQRETFHFVNLKFQANGVFQGGKFDASFSNVEFKNLPTGDWCFAGIPFHIVNSDLDELLGGDPGAADSVIILKGKNQQKYPEKAENIPIKRKAGKLHFLQTSAWAHIKDADPKYPVVTYRLTYQDGSTAETTATNRVHLMDWWYPIKKFTKELPGAKVGWAERNMQGSYVYKTLWVQTWENPHPEKQIESLDILSSENSVPLIFAVTTEGGK